MSAAAGPYARLDELTAIAGRFESELVARPGDRERLAQGHGRAMAARSAEIDRLQAFTIYFDGRIPNPLTATITGTEGRTGSGSAPRAIGSS